MTSKRTKQEDKLHLLLREEFEDLSEVGAWLYQCGTWLQHSGRLQQKFKEIGEDDEFPADDDEFQYFMKVACFMKDTRFYVKKWNTAVQNACDRKDPKEARKILEFIHGATEFGCMETPEVDGDKELASTVEVLTYKYVEMALKFVCC